MKKIGLIVLLSIACVWPAAAKPRPIRGSEQHKTQEVQSVAPFNALSIQGQIEVEFVQAPEGTYTVSFTGPYNLAELVEIKHQEHVLHIHYKEPLNILGDQHLRMKVSAPDLVRVEVKDFGEVHIHSHLTIRELDLALDGKADIEIDDLQAQAVRAELSGEAEVEILNLMCQTLEVKTKDKSSFEAARADCDTVSAMASNRSEASLTGLNGQSVTAESLDSAELELKGKVQEASLTARGHSEIDAQGLQAQNASVLAEKSAHIGVRVAGSLDAQTQGKGVVEYKGWPQQINQTGKGIVRPGK